MCKMLYPIIVVYQSTSNLHFYWFILLKAFPQRIFSNLAQMCRRDDVLAAYDNAVESSYAIARRSICVHRMNLANDPALFCLRGLYMPDARRNFTVHVKFARLLERDREKYQLRSLNEPASLFAPSEFARRNRFRTCFRVEELKSVWSCDQLASRVC